MGMTISEETPTQSVEEFFSIKKFIIEKKIVKEHKKRDSAIIWKPKTSIHPKTCAKTLPEAYDPKVKPWIKPEYASVGALKSQIDQCPFSALSYRIIRWERVGFVRNMTIVHVKPDDPLLVHGTLLITDQQGIQHKKDKTTAFCRCAPRITNPIAMGNIIK